VRLPNADELVVEREKIVDYLLNADHQAGATKAAFFDHFGFRIEEWEALAGALLETWLRQRCDSDDRNRVRAPLRCRGRNSNA